MTKFRDQKQEQQEKIRRKQTKTPYFTSIITAVKQIGRYSQYIEEISLEFAMAMGPMGILSRNLPKKSCHYIWKLPLNKTSNKI